MKMNVEKFVIVILTVALLVALLEMYQVMIASEIPVSSTSSNGAIGYEALVCKEVTRVDGTVENLGCNHNTFMNEGKEFLEDEIGTTASTNAINTLILGNETRADTPATLSAHPSEIYGCNLGAQAITWRSDSVGTGNISTDYKFTSQCSGIIVNTTGLNCTGATCVAGTDYFAGNNFTSVTLQTNDQLNVTWYVWTT